MDSISNKIKKSIGFKGEMLVIDKLKTLGFELYDKNIKHIDSEIDVVMYKYNRQKYSLDIRVIEVKTRNNYEFDLLRFDLSKKWRLVSKRLFILKSYIDAKFDVLSYSEVHFDLALVRHKNDIYDLYSYIKDVNLLL